MPLAVQLSSAVHYLTNEDVVHLDIKPSNTIMGAPPRMIDLSVALSISEAADAPDDRLAPTPTWLPSSATRSAWGPWGRRPTCGGSA